MVENLIFSQRLINLLFIAEQNNMSQQFITYYGEYSLKHWIRMILNGEITLPPYQRYFVWKPEKVLRLLENINDNLFVPPVILSSFSGDDKDKEANYILDGQQRLSAVLIAYLGFFPARFDNFITDLLNEDCSTSDGTYYEEEETSYSIKWNLTILQKLYRDSSVFNIEQLRKKLSDDKRYIKIDKDFIKSFKDQKSITADTLEMFLKINIDDTFLDTHFLGFSYIKPVTPNPSSEKNMFSSIFRNINISSVPLLPEESRAALYWLRPDLVNFLDPELFKSIKVNNRKMDFARSLAYVAEAYQIQKKNKSPDIFKVAIGYGRTRRFEDYIEKYVYSVTEDKNSDTFGHFHSIFPNYQLSLENLYKEFSKLSLPKSYPGLVELDFYCFGLFYWVLFFNRQINPIQKNELKFLLDKAIRKHKKNYPNVAQLGALRERLTISINIYKKFLEK